ncbi:hypothetical protein L218DRAFT_1000306 [Marasmius fiardii PR-910]|nr:hypothetical protein L218DRAFT_1000306 [Marasmius fiardii PR-910]
MPGSIFPSTGLQALSALIYFLGLSILAHFLSRRILYFHWGKSLWDVSWPRLCVLLIFGDSWCYLFTSGVLIFAIGLETNPHVCTAAIYLCITFYGSSKVLVYCFLVEKVYLVWSSTAEKRSRLRSPIYLICMTTNLAYFAVCVTMLVGKIHEFNASGACVIGLERFSSIPLLTLDLYTTVFLNSLFLWPLYRAKINNPVIRRVAVRTLVASLTALATSAINIAVLTIEHRELAWVCMGSCAADVLVNSAAVFWVTGRSDSAKAHIVSDPAANRNDPQHSHGTMITFAQSFDRQNTTTDSHALQVMVTKRTTMDADDHSDSDVKNPHQSV